MILGNYRGCRIFIYDEDGKHVACTSVIEHDKEKMTITVEGAFYELKKTEFVTVLIVTDKDAHEYRGRLRKTVDPETTDISLFKGQVRNSRSATRYEINTRTTVYNHLIESGLAPLLNPVSIFIENLSATGIKIIAKVNSFELDSVIEIKLTIDSKVTIIFGRIVRIKNIDITTAEYGCKFVFIN